MTLPTNKSGGFTPLLGSPALLRQAIIVHDLNFEVKFEKVYYVVRQQVA
ncbi:hypothetical protein [Anthocerotibacter panamensis]|nr:hypothetical protein [Anthocerotibacter panamensis]